MTFSLPLIDISAAYDFTRNIAAEVGAEIGSHGWLRQLFKDLLLEVDSCLEAVGLVAERQNESYGPDSIVSEDRPFGLAPFLVVLKGLHAIAKLYEGAMADLMEMLLVRRVSLNILIRQSRWQVITPQKPQPYFEKQSVLARNAVRNLS